jgi:hypothetical protein
MFILAVLVMTSHKGKFRRKWRCYDLARFYFFAVLLVNGVPRNFVRGVGGVQQLQLRTEDRENGGLAAIAPLVRGSGGSCNLVQEISFHILTFS